MKGLLQFLIAKIILLALASSVVTCYDPYPFKITVLPPAIQMEVLSIFS
uniref:Uncharacterized protein n=1 Tax=Brassica campestris TaxID=3711 RepID=A0A3P6A863_BRACM|nr:unnamed protein product [Brassica rapa]